MAKAKGIKRGSVQHAARKADLAMRRELGDRFERQVGMSIVDVEFCRALGRMGFRARDFFRLQETLVEVRREYAAEILDDAKVDRDFVYAKSRFDRELNSYVPECMRRTWEERHDLLDRNTPGLRIGPADNIPAEVEKYAAAFAAWKADNEIRKEKARKTRERKRGVINDA